MKDYTNQLAIDPNALNTLKHAAAQNTPESIKETAKQFEALFLSMMLKSMRDAAPQDALFNSEQGKMFVSMLDQELSQKMAERGMGLADMLEKQMLSQLTPPIDRGEVNTSLDSPLAPHHLTPQKINTDPTHPLFSPTKEKAHHATHVSNFQAKFSQPAQEASQLTGIPAHFMLAQAGLESGWGRHEIMKENGLPSHNLFGIKAGKNWQGPVVEVVTTEYEHGVAVKKTEKFRSYDNYTAAFQDYARLLTNNSRYQHVLANAKNAYEFAKGLQHAGYATDPHYADKLISIMSKNVSA